MKNFAQILIIAVVSFTGSRCNLEKIQDNLVNPGPTALFTVDKTGGEIPCTVAITNQSQNAFSYSWNFGNSTTSTLQQPGSVTYTTANDFTITLIVTDAAGLKDTFSVIIETTEPLVKFAKTFDTFGPGCKVRQLTDGGYIAAGTLNNDVFLVRTDAEGNIVNQRVFTDANADVANDVIQLSDGTFVVVGTTFNAAFNNNDIYYLRTNSSLNAITGPIRLGTNDGNDEAFSVIELTDGSVFMAGYTTNISTGSTDVYVARYSPDLSNLFFKKNISGANAEVAFDAISVSGGIAIAGEVSYPGSSALSDALFLKIDENGNLLGTIKAIGGSGFEQARAITSTGNGELILCGAILAPGGSDSDIFLQKIDTNGNTTAGAATPGGSQNDTGYDITPVDGGGFAIAGQSGLDAYLLLTDENGTSLLDKPFVLNGEEAFYSIEQTADKGFIFGGYKGSFLYVVKTDKDGNFN